MMAMFASMLETKLDAKLIPFGTEIHVLRTTMEQMNGQLETLATRVENLEVAGEADFDDGNGHDEENDPAGGQQVQVIAPARRTRLSAAAVLANHGCGKKNKVG